MKQCHLVLALIPALIFAASPINAMELHLHGKKAMNLYNELTGPAVHKEGAAGHLYRKGKCVLCRYTDVDMTEHGKAVPKHSPQRYACTIKFNHNGHAKPGSNP